MKGSLKKNQIVLGGLVIFLGVAVLVNWYYTSPENEAKYADSASDTDLSNVDSVNLGDAVYVNGSEISDEYFAGAKLSRDESYDEAVATLQQIIDSSEADEQSVQTASDSINEISKRRIAQTNIENLVTAKTGGQCVAVLSDDSAEIIIDDEKLSSDVILQIKEIVMDNTELPAEKITIIGAK